MEDFISINDIPDFWLRLLIDPYGYNDYGIKGNIEKGEENMKETVDVENYVIATRDKNTKKQWSIAPVPFVHNHYKDVIAEADRFAVLDSTREFIVLAVVAVVSVATTNRTYKL